MTFSRAAKILLPCALSLIPLPVTALPPKKAPVPAPAPAPAPKPAPAVEQEKTYIPMDLEDAVRVLAEQTPEADKEKIRKGELEPTPIRNRVTRDWIVAHGTARDRSPEQLKYSDRLKDYFRQNGVDSIQDMSRCVQEAFWQSVKGGDHDLLTILKTHPEIGYLPFLEWKKNDVLQWDRAEPLLYRGYELDESQRVVRTLLGWSPDDGTIQIFKGREKPRAATAEEIAHFREDKDHWAYSEADVETLNKLLKMTPDERVKALETLDRSKFDMLPPTFRFPVNQRPPTGK